MFGGLSFVGYPKLSVVRRSEEPTASQIAEHFGLEKSTVSGQMSQLEEAGLLCRAPSTSLPRMKSLELTEAGTTRLAAIRQRQRELLSERFGHWPDEEVEQFNRLLWCFFAEAD